MSSSEPNVPYIPKYPMVKGFTRKNAIVTRQQWDELVVKHPMGYGTVVANLLRDQGIEESKINEVLAEIHSSSEKRKLEKKRSRSSWSSTNTAYPKVADESLAVAITPPFVVNLEDDDDDVPLALRTSLSSFQKKETGYAKESRTVLIQKTTKNRFSNSANEHSFPTNNGGV